MALDWGANDDVLRACGRQLGATVRVRDLGERNRAELKRIGFEEDEFPFEAESFVGNHLMKTVVFNTYLEQAGVRAAFQGLRWDEQATRRNDPYFEDVASSALTPGHTRARPILHFSERDLWDATLHFKIPYCSALRERVPFPRREDDEPPGRGGGGLGTGSRAHGRAGRPPAGQGRGHGEDEEAGIHVKELKSGSQKAKV